MRRSFHALLVLCFVVAAGGALLAQAPERPFEPTVGQEGRDVVWVPTPEALVEKMLDLAAVTPKDFVIDLGSGDGRNVIAAAKRGARGLGVEYNPDMVELSRRIAAKEGVADKAEFMQGDMYEADISQATVLALFLLPENLNKLAPKFLDLKPGSRIVLNHFAVDGWSADETERADGDCGNWCTALLYIVPARVAGTWRFAKGELVLQQNYQMLTGSLLAGGAATPIADGRLRGEEITFSVGATKYAGRVTGDAMRGANGAWTATRIQPKTP
jgi:SAM-dependent methyltransferase